MNLSLMLGIGFAVLLALAGLLALGYAIGHRVFHRRRGPIDESTHATGAALVAIGLMAASLLVVFKLAIGTWLS